MKVERKKEKEKRGCSFTSLLVGDDLVMVCVYVGLHVNSSSSIIIGCPILQSLSSNDSSKEGDSKRIGKQ